MMLKIFRLEINPVGVEQRGKIRRGSGPDRQILQRYFACKQVETEFRGLSIYCGALSSRVRACSKMKCLAGGVWSRPMPSSKRKIAAAGNDQHQPQPASLHITRFVAKVQSNQGSCTLPCLIPAQDIGDSQETPFFFSRPAD